VEPADDLAGLRIADEHGERAKIVVTGLAQIVGAEPSVITATSAPSSSSVMVMSGSNLASSFGIFAYHSTGPVAGLDPAAYVF